MRLTFMIHLYDRELSRVMLLTGVNFDANSIGAEVLLYPVAQAVSRLQHLALKTFFNLGLLSISKVE